MHVYIHLMSLEYETRNPKTTRIRLLRWLSGWELKIADNNLQCHNWITFLWHLLCPNRSSNQDQMPQFDASATAGFPFAFRREQIHTPTPQSCELEALPLCCRWCCSHPCPCSHQSVANGRLHRWFFDTFAKIYHVGKSKYFTNLK